MTTHRPVSEQTRARMQAAVALIQTTRTAMSGDVAGVLLMTLARARDDATRELTAGNPAAGIGCMAVAVINAVDAAARISGVPADTIWTAVMAELQE